MPSLQSETQKGNPGWRMGCHSTCKGMLYSKMIRILRSRFDAAIRPRNWFYLKSLNSPPIILSFKFKESFILFHCGRNPNLRARHKSGHDSNFRGHVPTLLTAKVFLEGYI